MRVVVREGQADDATPRKLPRFPVSRLVGHDGPVCLVRFTGTYAVEANRQAVQQKRDGHNSHAYTLLAADEDKSVRRILQVRLGNVSWAIFLNVLALHVVFCSAFFSNGCL